MAATSVEDWPLQLAFLTSLQELMKCPICFDYMQAPVMLPDCDHNYCSLCIRKYFTNKEQCPSCGRPASSNQLRSNRLMDETIQQFKRIRQPLLALCSNTKETMSYITVEAQVLDSPLATSKKRKILHFNETFSDSFSNGSSTQIIPQKATGDVTSSKTSAVGTGPSHQPMTEWDECDRETISETSCSTARMTKDLAPASHQPLPPVSSPSVDHSSGLKGKAVQSKLLTHLAKSESGCRISDSGAGLSNMKENIDMRASKLSQSRGSGSVLATSPKPASPLVALLSRNSSKSPSPKSSHKVSLPLVPSGTEIDLTVEQDSAPPGVTSPAGKALCPVCGVLVVSMHINQHLDICLSRQEKKRTRRSWVEKKPLPKLVYNLMSDKDVRKRLKELGLNSQGDRQTLIKRHHEFTLYYNADCDSHNPRDMAELIKEFGESQKLQAKLNTKSSSTSKQSILRFTKDQKSEDIEKSLKKYAKQHKTHFQSLIQDIRRRKQVSSKSSSASATSSAENSFGECSQQSEQQSSNSQESSISCPQDVCVVVDDDNDSEFDIHTQSESEIYAAEEQIVNKSSDEFTAKPHSKGQASSVGSVAELEGVTGIEEHKTDSEGTDSDVFDTVSDPDCRPKSAAGRRGKRALKPCKPGWQDSDLCESSAPADRLFSHTSTSRSRSASHSPNTNTLSSMIGRNQSESLSDNCQSDESTVCPGLPEMSELHANLLQKSVGKPGHCSSVAHCNPDLSAAVPPDQNLSQSSAQQPMADSPQPPVQDSPHDPEPEPSHSQSLHPSGTSVELSLGPVSWQSVASSTTLPLTEDSPLAPAGDLPHSPEPESPQSPGPASPRLPDDGSLEPELPESLYPDSSGPADKESNNSAAMVKSQLQTPEQHQTISSASLADFTSIHSDLLDCGPVLENSKTSISSTDDTLDKTEEETSAEAQSVQDVSHSKVQDIAASAGEMSQEEGLETKRPGRSCRPSVRRVRSASVPTEAKSVRNVFVGKCAGDKVSHDPGVTLDPSVAGDPGVVVGSEGVPDPVEAQRTTVKSILKDKKYTGVFQKSVRFNKHLAQTQDICEETSEDTNEEVSAEDAVSVLPAATGEHCVSKRKKSNLLNQGTEVKGTCTKSTKTRAASESDLTIVISDTDKKKHRCKSVSRKAVQSSSVAADGISGDSSPPCGQEDPSEVPDDVKLSTTSDEVVLQDVEKLSTISEEVCESSPEKLHPQKGKKASRKRTRRQSAETAGDSSPPCGQEDPSEVPDDVELSTTYGEVVLQDVEKLSTISKEVCESSPEKLHPQKGKKASRKRTRRQSAETADTDMVGNNGSKKEMILSPADVVKTKRRRAKENTAKKTKL